ncbi:hypothetical protein PoB_005744900 [Plakobranchus ocellatus]|uniref:Uncharacterized protein n=1 Tax=Plakobranchus ocellatus TaxID=259542 RepID=A0AAV4CJC0_9GAST|nr:hypothetical protein PoB_005744900 [Plakobranchus ocellatus]
MQAARLDNTTFGSILKPVIIRSSHHRDWLLGPPSGKGTGGGARTRDRRVAADLRADSLTTEPPTPHILQRTTVKRNPIVQVEVSFLLQLKT